MRHVVFVVCVWDKYIMRHVVFVVCVWDMCLADITLIQPDYMGLIYTVQHVRHIRGRQIWDNQQAKPSGCHLDNKFGIKGATIRLPGGGAGFFSLARIFFSVTFRAKIFFFKLSWARIFFSQAILGQNILFYTIQTNLETTFQLSRKSVSKLLYWGCLLSVCVCVRPRWF